MGNVKYIDPLFQELLKQIPEDKKRESELSYGIARRIHDVLARKGWSQADLARATGKRETVISRWMSGTHNFTIQTIAEIETALDEEILSVRQYRRLSSLVDGYQARPARTAFLDSNTSDLSDNSE